MNGFERIQALKILSCYNIEKGGVGSGRHKEGNSSVNKLEQTNFSNEEDMRQKNVASYIVYMKEKQKQQESNIRKYDLMIDEQQRIISSHEKAGMTKDQDYHRAVARKARYERERKEAYEHLKSLKSRIDAINH